MAPRPGLLGRLQITWTRTWGPGVSSVEPPSLYLLLRPRKFLSTMEGRTYGGPYRLLWSVVITLGGTPQVHFGTSFTPKNTRPFPIMSVGVDGRTPLRDRLPE